MKICALIPARYNSSRLPGKPLLLIKGKTMIQRTWEQTCKSNLIDDVYVVTDDDRIINNCEKFGAKTIKITEKCLNGTERICYALDNIENIEKIYDIIVNVQGDEPFINPKDIDISIETYKKNINNKNMVCSTLHYRLESVDDIYNKNIGKLILNKNNNILYCSRGVIPNYKNNMELFQSTPYFGHIGIFVFRYDFLKNYLKLENTPAMLSEDIEWLKILENGYDIISSCTNLGEISINTEEDYQYIINKKL